MNYTIDNVNLAKLRKLAHQKQLSVEQLIKLILDNALKDIKLDVKK